MNWVDLVVLAVILLSGLLGLGRGLVREALGVAAWIGAIWASFTFYEPVQPVVARWLPNPDLSTPATLLAVFVAALIVFSVIAQLIGRLVQRSWLGGLDRTLGAVFGLIRGGAILVAAYILGGMAIPPEQWPDPVQDARSLPFVHEAAIWTADRFPPEHRPAVAALPSQPDATAGSLLQQTPWGHPMGPQHPVKPVGP